MPLALENFGMDTRLSSHQELGACFFNSTIMAINTSEMLTPDNRNHEPITIPKWPILSIIHETPLNFVPENSREGMRYRVDRPPTELINDLYQQILVQKNKQEQSGLAAPGIAMVRIAPGSVYGDVARYVEAREFKNAWYQDLSPEEFCEEMHKEYEPYDEDSRFILLLDTDNLDATSSPALMGMSRMVGGRPELLKTVNDMEEVWGVPAEIVLEDIKKSQSEQCSGDNRIGDPAYVWDCSSMAVAPEYRNSQAYPIISHELYHWCSENGIKTTTTIFVKKFFNLYRFRGVPFRTIAGAEPRIHMGEISLPAVLHWPEVGDMPKNDENPRAMAGYLEMAQGVGLDYLAFEAA